jgi:tRNA-Thr(GGU) m(6)t(6)A37 methyltransferase TsaA
MEKLENIVLKPIGYIFHEYSDEEVRNSFNGVNAIAKILPEYEEGLKGIEGFSHIILVSYLHKAKEFRLIVKPRRLLKLGIKEEEIPDIGVFSTDSPMRPNSIGISVVRLIKRNKNELYIENCDLFNGTPLLDIKPLTEDKLSEKVTFPDWYIKLLKMVKERSGISLRTI